MRRRHSLRYRWYIHTPLWRFRRFVWWLKAGQRCERCGCGLGLHRGKLPGAEVHHRTYKRLGWERRSDIQIVCGACHLQADEQRRQWLAERFR